MLVVGSGLILRINGLEQGLLSLLEFTKKEEVFHDDGYFVAHQG